MAQESTLSETLPREPAEARLSRLYRDHGREITGYALRRAASPEDAADVVAETHKQKAIRKSCKGYALSS